MDNSPLRELTSFLESSECESPATRPLFVVIPEEWLKPETGWRSEVKFELPVPISEQPDENMMSASAAPRRSVWDRLRLKRLVGLYGRQHSKETFPSCAMNDIATDVAAAIQ